MSRLSIFITAVLLFFADIFVLNAGPTNNLLITNSQERIKSIIKQQYNNKNREVVVHIRQDHLALPENCIIDVETGAGHQGYLNFIRLELKGEESYIEKILLNRGSIYGEPDPMERSQVKRTCIKRKYLNDILEAISLLPSINLSEISLVDRNTDLDGQFIENEDGILRLPGILIEGISGSSYDFFVLVRVMNENRKILIAKEYGGYERSTKQIEYLPLVAVSRIVEARLDEIEEWENVPSSKQRECHLSDAFNLNRAYLTEDFHWWVLEHSLEGLARIGNKSVIETVKYVDNNYVPREERISKKVKAITENSDYWLSGGPKDLTTIEKTK